MSLDIAKLLATLSQSARDQNFLAQGRLVIPGRLFQVQPAKTLVKSIDKSRHCTGRRHDSGKSRQVCGHKFPDCHSMDARPRIPCPLGRRDLLPQSGRCCIPHALMPQGTASVHGWPRLTKPIATHVGGEGSPSPPRRGRGSNKQVYL